MNAQDSQAEFEQLLQRNRGRLAAVAHAYAEGDADDLLQEILLQIWRSLRRFQGRASIDTWCYRIALNTAISWRRTNGRRALRLPPAAVELDQIVGKTPSCDATQLLQKFLRSLSDVDRGLLLMVLEDMSGADMAQALGISVGAVRVRIHRIKQRLSEWTAGDA